MGSSEVNRTLSQSPRHDLRKEMLEMPSFQLGLGLNLPKASHLL